jgi:uncharacterized protein YlzI (FlbEa/FlbD family)
MTVIDVGESGKFNLTRLDGTRLTLTDNDIVTLAARHKPTRCTELVLVGGERVLVQETVPEILDACEESEETRW